MSQAFKADEQFNPWRQACGFYPPDVVAALPAVKVPGTGRRLIHGHKLLSARLVGRWCQAGPCFPAQKCPATQLGISIRTIKNWIEDIEAVPLIRRRRGRGDGRAMVQEYIEGHFDLGEFTRLQETEQTERETLERMLPVLEPAS